MPKDSTIHSVLVMGSGAIITGQGVEFDYAGTQACMALQEEGIRVILVNNNPATMMTDCSVADATYFVEMKEESLQAIIEKEKPDGILYSFGGQTALNLCIALEASGFLAQHRIRVLGPSLSSVRITEDRQGFAMALSLHSIPAPLSVSVRGEKELEKALTSMPFPVLIRRGFSLGGKGSIIAENFQQAFHACKEGFDSGESIQIDADLTGWQEFEVEVIRDCIGSEMIVAVIENIDPVGVHTGDSISVVPALTLPDVTLQKIRKLSFSLLNACKFTLGAANIQWAVDPKTHAIYAIEMNARLSRSSSLVSKATGYPIARVATLIAIGYTLAEIKSSKIYAPMPAAMEPSLDYIAVKIPLFAFGTFTGLEDKLSTKMQAIGEVLALGSTFCEAFSKAMRSVGMAESNGQGLAPSSKRLSQIVASLKEGASPDALAREAMIHPWFIQQLHNMVAPSFLELQPLSLFAAKKRGLSDAEIALLFRVQPSAIFQLRREWDIMPVFKQVDGCCHEGRGHASTFFSTYQEECELGSTLEKCVVVIGSGGNRIGQGSECDYMCVKALEALRSQGRKTVMLQCNPASVSSDPIFCDRLYITPLVEEDVLDILFKEKPSLCVVSFGGQTALNLASCIERAGFTLLGPPAATIDLFEDRGLLRKLLSDMGILQPRNWVAKDSLPLNTLPYPVIVRPSYVLGGEGMKVVANAEQCQELLAKQKGFQGSILLEQLLIGARELDADFIVCSNGKVKVWITSQEEPAGIHSGDSKHLFPAEGLTKDEEDTILCTITTLTERLQLQGIFNIQLLTLEGRVYVLEINPRASRLIPFLMRATQEDLVLQAIFAMLSIPCNWKEKSFKNFYFRKMPVFSLHAYPMQLGPVMTSTGEVMHIIGSCKRVTKPISLQEIYDLKPCLSS